MVRRRMGPPRGYVGTQARQATPRRSAERRFRDLVHEVDGIVWELEPATQRFTFVNRRAEELLGYPIERWLAAQDFRATLIDPRVAPAL